MITEETITKVFPEAVEFRTPTNFGCRVVKVYTTCLIPRISAWSEWVIDAERRHEPLSLTLDEIILFADKAWSLNNRAFTLVETLQALGSNTCKSV